MTPARVVSLTLVVLLAALANSFIDHGSRERSSAYCGELTQHARALPSLDARKPFLPVTRQRKACTNRSIRTLTTSAIASGFSAGELMEWHENQDLHRQFAKEQRTSIARAAQAIWRAKEELLIDPALRELGEALALAHQDLSEARWFMARVESPYR